MRGQFGWYPTVLTQNKAILKANSTPHRYIHSVLCGSGGGLVIRGVIGERLFLDYSLREAMKKYNAEAKLAIA